MTTNHPERRLIEDRRSNFTHCPKFDACVLTEDQIVTVVERVLAAYETKMQDRILDKAENKLFEKIGRLFAAKFFIWTGVIVVLIVTIAQHLKKF